MGKYAVALAGGALSGLFLATITGMFAGGLPSVAVFVAGGAATATVIGRARSWRRAAGTACLVLALEGMVYPVAGLLSSGVAPAGPEALPSGRLGLAFYEASVDLKVVFGHLGFVLEPVLATLAYLGLRRRR